MRRNQNEADAAQRKRAFEFRYPAGHSNLPKRKTPFKIGKRKIKPFFQHSSRCNNRKLNCKIYLRSSADAGRGWSWKGFV